MSVKLRKKENKDGSVSLYLDIYHNGFRKYEFLKHLKQHKPGKCNPAEREANREKWELAKKIEIKMAQELSADEYSITTDAGKKTLVVEWMQSYIDRYKKKDKRNLQGALKRFSDFLLEENTQNMTFVHLTEIILSEFQDYLRSKSKGEGASSYFNRFKKMVKHAYRQKLIAKNPAADVPTIQGHAKKRDILTMAEIQKLANTQTESTVVKRAFLFSCLTGCRWIEVSGLKWSQVNMNGKYIDILQGKGDAYKRVNLNDTAIALLEKPGKKESLVFDLPTANGANKTLKAWVKRSKIEKTITWHNARHSFGTNLIFSGSDLSTARHLLGHSSFKHTQRYIKAAEELKETATNKLNIDL